MATIEERLQAIEQEHRALEQEHSQLKKTIELQTIAIGALVNKATLEKLNEKYDKLFESLIAHDRLTNEQLADVRKQLTETDGKIVGLQTEMRQRFNDLDNKFAVSQGIQAEHTSSLQQHTSLLQQHTGLLQQILARLPEQK